MDEEWVVPPIEDKAICVGWSFVDDADLGVIVAAMSAEGEIISTYASGL